MEPQYADPNAAMPQADPSYTAAAVPNMPSMAPAMQPAQAPLGTSMPAIPMVAEDSDTIEPAWVAAIKRTIEQYKDDPYALSQAMTALRQDYLQKRYGKTIEAAK